MAERTFSLSFKRSGDDLVARVNGRFAAYIDEMNALRLRTEDPEVKRLANIVITEAQTAQMWAVKALTWRA